MNKKIFYVLCFAILILFIVLFCCIIIKFERILYITENEVIYKDSNKNQETYDNSNIIENFINFLSSNERYKLYPFNSINITRHSDYNGNWIYLAKTSSQFFWESELFIIFIEDNKISDVIKTGLSGFDKFLSYNVVKLSQGIFIAAYCSSHMGNGNLELVSITEPEIIKYTLPYAVDYYYESDEITSLKYGLKDGNVMASEIYLGAKLYADYFDVDMDGNTDIILSGIQQIYVEGEDGKQFLKSQYYIKNVYRFDNSNNDFIWDKNLSRKILIEE